MIGTTPSNYFEVSCLELSFVRKNVFSAAPITLTKVTFQVIFLGETLDVQMSKYGNFLFVGDFNS